MPSAVAVEVGSEAESGESALHGLDARAGRLGHLRTDE